MGLLFRGETGKDRGAGLLEVEAGFVHPGMGLNLLNGRAFVPVVSEEAQDEALKLRSESLAIDLGEVGVDLSRQEQVVEVLFLACFLEGKDALHNDEQDYAHGEQIDLRPFVHLSFFNLGSHVGHRPTVRLQRIDALVACEPEVCKLEVQFVVDKDVFQLEVSVDYPA